MQEPTEQQVTDAIRTLTAAGAVIVTHQPHFSIGSAARQLDISKGWLREHLEEFPNAWRLPSSNGTGELRIPARDIEALAKRRRMEPKLEVAA